MDLYRTFEEPEEDVGVFVFSQIPEVEGKSRSLGGFTLAELLVNLRVEVLVPEPPWADDDVVEG